MSDPTNEPQHEPQHEPRTPPAGNPAGVTPLRLVVWIVGAVFALFLIVTGIIGILTKAR